MRCEETARWLSVPAALIYGVEPDRAIAALAESQYGLVTRAQAVSRGLSEAGFDRRVASGNWTRVHRGVYRLTGSPQTPEQSVKAACLAIPGALASHRAAAAILGLPEIQPRVEITVLQSRRIRLEAVQVHRTTRLETVDRDFEKGIPVTSLARTMIDLCGVLAKDQMASALDHVLAKRRVPGRRAATERKVTTEWAGDRLSVGAAS